jgi:Putative S-adenosyl-L-methionine-dependent methyltransferase
MDHIAANKIIKNEGFFKRAQDMINQYFDRSRQMKSNIFAPTAALKLIKHISDNIPEHSLIMADFDSFLMPKNSIKGINAPLVTNKLKDPTQWQTYDTYLIDRGAADICFPVDFHFL